MSEVAQQDATKSDLTNDQLIAHYVKLRDRKDELGRDLDTRLGPIKEAMERIEQVMHARLLESGTQAFKTAEGTAFLKEQTSVMVKNWAAETLPYIVTNQRWDLLEASVAKKAVLAHMDANGGNVPPGVKYSARMVVQIRRGKADD